MNERPGIRAGVRRLFRLGVRRPERLRAEIDEELAAHVEARVEYLMARGWGPEAARDEAVRRLGGNLEMARERVHRSARRREQHMAFHERLQDIAHDVRYAVRGLLLRPGFTVTAVLTLAVGIGATTAIFSAVHAVLLRPLPFPEPGRLMHVSLVTPPNPDVPNNDDMVWSVPKYAVFARGQTVFERHALYAGDLFTLTGGEAERVAGEWTGAQYFTTLGVPLPLGRGFTAAQDEPGAARTVVIGDALWQRRFNADPTVIGRTLQVDGEPFTIVGVAPAAFRGLGGSAEVFVPIATRSAEDLSQAQSHEFSLVARLKPAVTAAQAAGEVRTLGARISEAFPDAMGGAWGAQAVALDRTRAAPQVRRSLLVLFGAVGFVLLIACVNLASLMLGRAGARGREIAIRLAIGANRARLVRLLLTESLVVALLGGMAGTVVAWWGTRALSVVDPEATLRAQRLGGLGAAGFSTIHLDWTTLLFTAAVAVAVGVVFGLVPALKATAPVLTDALKEGGALVATRGRHGGRGRRVLVVAEVAMAVVLLAGSGLMLRSLARLLAVDSGFDARGVLTLRLSANGAGYQRDSMPGFYAALTERLAALPGVTAVGLGNCAPLSGGCNRTKATFPDRGESGPEQGRTVGVHWASPGLFAALRVPLRRGRLFTAADRLGAPKVVLVNETAAARLWPGEDPVGRRIAVYQGGFHDGATVIGVVGDLKFVAPDSGTAPDVFLPYDQAPRAAMIVYLRASGDPGALAVAARRAVAELAPDLPVYDVQTMAARAATATAQARFSAALLGLFAAVALALAAIGIYGVMSVTVAQRTREIGIRMALGADRRGVVRQVIGEGAGLAAAGALVGLGGAVLLTRTLRSLLYGVAPTDPWALGAAVVVLGAATLSACWLPARRAARVDPMVALRQD